MVGSRRLHRPRLVKIEPRRRSPFHSARPIVIPANRRRRSRAPPSRRSHDGRNDGQELLLADTTHSRRCRTDSSPSGADSCLDGKRCAPSGARRSHTGGTRRLVIVRATMSPGPTPSPANPVAINCTRSRYCRQVTSTAPSAVRSATRSETARQCAERLAQRPRPGR